MASSCVAVGDGFGDDFDPLNAPKIVKPKILTSRVNKVPRKKGSQTTTTPLGSPPTSVIAPWLQSDEADERERKEDMRKALRDKIKAKRRARGAAGAGKEEEEGGGVSLSQIKDLDIGMIQQMAAKMGIPADQLPSKRQLMRRLNGKNLDDLVSKAKAQGK